MWKNLAEDIREEFEAFPTQPLEAVRGHYIIHCCSASTPATRATKRTSKARKALAKKHAKKAPLREALATARAKRLARKTKVSK